MSWVGSLFQGREEHSGQSVDDLHSATHHETTCNKATTITQHVHSNNQDEESKDSSMTYALNDMTRQQIIRLDTKLAAITRASLQLSENSYSFERDQELYTKTSTSNAPTGWEAQYKELLSLLKQGLLGYNDDKPIDESTRHTRCRNKSGQTNISAVLMGLRGQGKSFILERCLSDLSALARTLKQNDNGDELDAQVAFRVVRLNGLLYAGDNAVACIREIARQIGEMAGSKRRHSDDGSARKRMKLDDILNNDETNKSTDKITSTPDNRDDEHESSFTTRRSGFNSNLSLLDESLQTARIDNIPILIVLEELDTFIANGKMMNNSSEDGGDDVNNNRQLLLYHLLDRVADHKFLVSLVGITTDLRVVSRLEKRVLSRAEGTSKFIYFGRMTGYNDLVEGSLMAFHCPLNSSEVDQVAMMALRKEVEFILKGGENYYKEEDVTNDYSVVRRVIEHNYGVLNMDMRWFCRVIDVALGLLASDIEEIKCSHGKNLADNIVGTRSCSTIDKLRPKHMAIALSAIGARVCDIVKAKRPGIPSSHSLILNRWERLISGPYRGYDPRIRALFDLSGPQVAVILAARRILARDDTRSRIEHDVEAARRNGITKKTIHTMATPITYQRIHDEYSTSFVASGKYTISSDRYPSHLLYRAFIDLIELDLMRFKREHSKRGSLQFEHCDSLSNGANLINLPLHVNFDMEGEFVGLLKASSLHCSTALREWGLRIN